MLHWKHRDWLMCTLTCRRRLFANKKAATSKLEDIEGLGREGGAIGMEHNAYHLACTGPSTYKKVL